MDLGLAQAWLPVITFVRRCEVSKMAGGGCTTQERVSGVGIRPDPMHSIKLPLPAHAKEIWIAISCQL